MTREEWLTIIKKAITDIDGLEWEKGMNGLTTTIRLNRNDAMSLYELIENNDTKFEESPRPSKPRTIDPPAYIFDLESGVISKSTNTSTKSVDTSTKSIDVSTEATKHEPSEDGTLEVKVKDATKVGRVLISDDKHRGGLYYPDEDEPQQEVPKIIVHVDRPKGHWIDMPYTPSHTKYMCSECGKVMYTNSEYIKEQNFCFSCGAYMEGEDK